jgi:hypothetical protein
MRHGRCGRVTVEVQLVALSSAQGLLGEVGNRQLAGEGTVVQLQCELFKRQAGVAPLRQVTSSNWLRVLSSFIAGSVWPMVAKFSTR